MGLEDFSNFEKIYKRALFYQKEFGLETTLLVRTFLKWKDPQKNVFYTSPLFFEEVRIIKKRKIETQYEIQSSEEKLYTNPILINALKRSFDVELDHVVHDYEESNKKLMSSLETSSFILENKTDFNDEDSWQLIEIERLGNFNYKKSSLAKDFDSIAVEPANSIKALFGESQQSISPEEIVPLLGMDASQRIALEFAASNNAVIQGPPGTGKSQSIVNLIGHFVSRNKRVLFVSQKRSALDVVYERISELGLANLVAYFNSEKDEKKHFYSVLRTAWDEMNSSQFKKPENHTERGHKILDFYLKEFINREDGSQSSFDLSKRLLKSSYERKELHSKGTVPSIEKWTSAFEKLTQIDTKAKKVFMDVPIGEQPFLQLNRSLVAEKDLFGKVEKRTEDFRKVVSEVENLIEKFDLNDSLSQLTKLCIAASLLNMVNNSQLELLLSDSKGYKSFGNWAKKYELAKSKYERQLVLNSKWKNKPSKSEITELMDLVKHHHAPKGIMGILRRRSERLDGAFEGFDPEISNTAKIQLLEELRTEWNLKGQLEEITLKLKHNFEITNPDVEIDLIFQVRSKLDKVSQSDYLKLLEHENSVDLIKELASFHPKIQSVNHLLKFTFDQVEIESISTFNKKIDFLEKNMRGFRQFDHELSEFFKLDKAIIGYIRSNADQDLELLNANVLNEHLKISNKFNDAFELMNGESLVYDLKSKMTSDLNVSRHAVEKLNDDLAAEYDKFEELLGTPSAKLKHDQKEIKKRLKKQKKIMLHEIAKKQQHLSVQQFMSECWEYLSIFQKVWVMNPLAVSQRLPLEKGLFDVVIFDESSQIPLEDALPAIQRSNQIVVVGDEKQMPPSQFFSVANEQFTLLDQAQLSFKKEMFVWHYRSLNPDLIKFSNRKFYNDNLLTFPSIANERPIEFVKVDGVFSEGTNLKEAEEIAKYLSKSTDLKSKGVIAFSVEQEKLIRKKLSEHGVNIEELLIRNLENVQGVERDEIIISIGYGFNEDGSFRMNFGPVNRDSGPNRLNVMFSRAKTKMKVYSSVSSSDFKISDNPGVNCLKDFIAFCENSMVTNDGRLDLPEELDFLDSKKLGLISYGFKSSSSFTSIVQEKSGKILLVDPCAKEIESNDLSTIYSVLSARFKSVKIVLSHDRWVNPDRFKNEIELFFS